MSAWEDLWQNQWFRLNLRVTWKPVNLQDCVWKTLYRIIMETILQEKAQCCVKARWSEVTLVARSSSGWETGAWKSGHCDELRWRVYQIVAWKKNTRPVSACSSVCVLQWRRHGWRSRRMVSESSGWVVPTWEIRTELRRWVWSGVLIRHVSLVFVRLTSHQKLDTFQSSLKQRAPLIMFHQLRARGPFQSLWLFVCQYAKKKIDACFWACPSTS